MVVGQHPDGRHGVFVSVDTHDLGEIVSLAKKLDDLHFALYATEETAAAIARLGIDVVTVDGIRESDHAFALLESGASTTSSTPARSRTRPWTITSPAPPRAAARHPVLHLARHGQRPGGHHRQPLQRAQHRARGHQPHAHRAPEPEVCEMQATATTISTSRTLTDTSPAPSRCASRSARATAASAATASCSSSTATWPTRKCVSSTATAAPAAWRQRHRPAWPSTCTTTASCRATISRSRPAAPCTGCTCTRASARSAS